MMKTYNSVGKLVIRASLAALVLMGMFGGQALASEEPAEGEQIVFTASRTLIEAGECVVLEWGVENADRVDLNGEAVEPAGEIEVCPEVTTTYTLSVELPRGLTERQIVIDVSRLRLFEADLAITDIYPAALPQGKVYARLTNHGPDTITNRPVQLYCVVQRSVYPPSYPSVTDYLPLQTFPITLSPGKSLDVDLSYVVNTSFWEFWVICEVYTSFNDTTHSNNIYSETISQP